MKQYKESQSFLTKWLIVLFLVFFCIEFYDLYTEYSIVKSINIGVSFWIILIVIIAFVLMRLQTNIDHEGISIRFIPFVIRKKILWTEIEEVYLTEYTLSDFGGWGYRVGSKGTAYTTKGKYGVQLVLKNGKRLLIGTQNPEDVKQVLANCFDSK